MLGEVAQPKSAEEKAFKDQHEYEVIKHPVADEAQHTGDIKGKTRKARPADQDGGANYDKAYSKKNDDGVKLTKESSEMDRARYDADDAAAPKKKVTLPKAPWDKKKKDEELSAGQKKIDHNKNGKIDGHDLAMIRKKKNEEVELDEAQIDKMKFVSKGFSNRKAADRHNDQLVGSGKASQKSYVYKHKDNKFYVADMKEDLDETTTSALKRPVTQTGADGKTRTVMKKARNDRTDDQGQDHIQTNEEASLDEAYKKGPLRLKDGKQVMVSAQDAKLLTQMFKDLSANNRKKMEKVLMTDKAGFDEIVGFAREAL